LYFDPNKNRRESTMKKKMFSVLMVSVLCLVFVGAAASQNPTAEWQKSKHANRELAVHEATWEGRKEMTAHCARCHGEQGFRAWLPQLMKGDPAFFKKPDGGKADEAYIKSLGLTRQGSADHLRSLPHDCTCPAHREQHPHAPEWAVGKRARQGSALYGMPQHPERSYHVGQS